MKVNELIKLKDLYYDNSDINDNIFIKNNDNNNAKKFFRKQKNVISLEDKINLLLNKLSNDNIDVITEDFINSVEKISIDQYEQIQTIIFNRIVDDYSFLDIFLNFLFQINIIYSNVQSYNLIKFVQLIQDNFISIYVDRNKIVSEEKKLSLLKIIMFSIPELFSKNETINYCTHHIVESEYIYDIYYWINNNFEYVKDNKVIVDKVNNIINNNNQISRSYILLENIMDSINKAKGDYQDKAKGDYQDKAKGDCYNKVKNK